MVKAVLTPAHPHSLEALLDEPLTRTLDHATPHRQAQVFVLRIVEMIPVPLKVRIQRRKLIPCGVRQALDRKALDKAGKAPVRRPMPQPVPCPATGTAQRGKSPGCPRQRPPTAPHTAAISPVRH